MEKCDNYSKLNKFYNKGAKNQTKGKDSWTKQTIEQTNHPNQPDKQTKIQQSNKKQIIHKAGRVIKKIDQNLENINTENINQNDKNFLKNLAI